MKKEVRILGIDDGPFDKSKKGKVLVVGTIFRGGSFLDGIISTKVTIDGTDATKKLIKLINGTKHKPQLQYIILDGIALGGFNVVDIEELHKKTSLPVIVVIRRMPDLQKITETLIKIGQEQKISLLKKAGQVYPLRNIFIQLKGLNIKEAEEVLKISCTRSLLPEPIRVAHIIASGIVTGESKGSA
jgi:endonuclease V-like protein UPF0215 family